jgi:6-phosphofructo-2-kinase/fructose-2,6-biphosphatase 2
LSQWLEFNVKVFNVGQLRRRKARELPKGQVNHGEKYFDHSDAEAKRVREQLAEESLDTLIDWLKREGNVGIHGKCCAQGRCEAALTLL